MAQRKLNKKLTLEKIKKLHKQGKSLKPIDNEALYQSAVKYFGSYQKALKKLGLSYELLGIRDCSRKWNRERVVIELRKLKRKHIPLNSVYMQKNYPALLTAATRYFGSYENAINVLGLNYRNIRQLQNLQGWVKNLSSEDIEELSKRIKRLYSNGGG